jgi:hypothetical protein
MNGFTDDQIEIRKGGASWDNKINVLATAQQIATNSGQMKQKLEAFLYSRLLKKI